MPFWKKVAIGLGLALAGVIIGFGAKEQKENAERIACGETMQIPWDAVVNARSDPGDSHKCTQANQAIVTWNGTCEDVMSALPLLTCPIPTPP